MTWVRAHAYTLGLTLHPDEDLLKNKNVHVHCPAGAVPKVHNHHPPVRRRLLA